MIIGRGTTPLIDCVVEDIDFSDATVAYVTFSQYGTTIVEKSLSDCTFSGHHLYVPLTQTDTLKFDSREDAKVQIRLKTASGAFDTTELEVEVGGILKEGEI